MSTPKRPNTSAAAKARKKAGGGKAKTSKARRTDSATTVWIGAIVVVVVLGGALIAFAVTRDPGPSSKQASSQLVEQVTQIDPAVYDKVGTGTPTGAPKPIDAPALTKDGKPRIVYMGAEYCPYCAAERWAMATALARFGTFENLGVTTSSSTDVYPSTPTLTFYGSTYSSPHVAFESVELNTNELVGNGYKTLQKPTAEQAKLLAKYDAPPYVTGGSGSIPFVDFGNRYIISGATFDPKVLQGKSFEAIGSALNDPNSDVAKAALGAANTITAAICDLTKGQPADVCNTSAVKSGATTLAAAANQATSGSSTATSTPGGG